MPPLEAMISISEVSKLFGSVTAVDNVTLDIARNEFFASSRSIRLRQDDAAAPACRVRDSQRR